MLLIFGSLLLAELGLQPVGAFVPGDNGDLTNVNIEAVPVSSNTTATTTTWKFAFKVEDALNNPGYLKIDLPSGFELDGGKPVGGSTTVCDLRKADGTDVTGETTEKNTVDVWVKCKLGVGQGFVANTAYYATLTNILNPPSSGLTPAITLETWDGEVPDDLENDWENPVGEYIVPSTLPSFSISGSPATTGVAQASWLVHFVSDTGIEANGKIVVDFPADLTVSSASECTGITGVTTTRNTTTGVVTCTIPAGLAEGATVDLSITKITNPPTARTTATFRVETQKANGVVYQWHTTNTEAILPHAFSAGPSLAMNHNRQVGATNDLRFNFTTFNPWGNTGKINITFPAGYTFNSGGTTTASFAAGGSGGFGTVSISGQKLTFARNGQGSTINASTAVGIVVTKIRNPTTNGTTGKFYVNTTDSTGAVHDSGEIAGIQITGTTTTTPTTTTTGTTSTTTATTTATTVVDNTSTITTTETTGTTGTQTVTNQTTVETGNGKGSPGLAPVLVMALMVAVVALWRRRE